MLLYDWKKIFTVANGEPSSIFTIFEMLVKQSIPKNKYDPAYKFYEMNFAGDCFLVHPDVLLYNSFRHSRRDVAIYLAFCEYAISWRILRLWRYYTRSIGNATRSLST